MVTHQDYYYWLAGSKWLLIDPRTQLLRLPCWQQERTIFCMRPRYVVSCCLEKKETKRGFGSLLIFLASLLSIVVYVLCRGKLKFSKRTASYVGSVSEKRARRSPSIIPASGREFNARGQQGCLIKLTKTRVEPHTKHVHQTNAPS